MTERPGGANGAAGADAERATTVLVVDDAEVDRLVAGAIVEQTLGWRAVYADNGRTALEAVEREKPQVILTDLNMAEMNGLELVAAVRRRYPMTPVVLMTAFGNEEIALRALRAGAASYVPKWSLDGNLAETLKLVVSVATVERRHQLLLNQITHAKWEFALENDRSLVPALVTHLQPHLVRMGLCDQTGKIRVGVALEEALLNAMYHGNLEVSSELRQQGEAPYHRLADARRRQPPYATRQVFCTATLSPERAEFVVRDEGPGFSPSTLPDPTDPANLGKVGGRGLLLIHTFMDAVTYNAAGNQITLVKRRDPARGQPA